MESVYERIQNLKRDFNSETHVREYKKLHERVRVILRDVETGEETRIYGKDLDQVMKELIPLFERKIKRKQSLGASERKELQRDLNELKKMFNEGRWKKKEDKMPPGSEDNNPMIDEFGDGGEGEEGGDMGGAEEEAIEGEELGAPSIKFTGEEDAMNTLESGGPFDWFKKKAKEGAESITGRIPKHKIELSERIRLEFRVCSVFLREYVIVTLEKERDMNRSKSLEQEIKEILKQTFGEILSARPGSPLGEKMQKVINGFSEWLTKMEAYLLAIKSGANGSEFMEEWITTGKEIGDDMQNLNPTHWDTSIVGKSLKDIVNTLRDIAKAVRSKSWGGVADNFDRLVDEFTEFADLVANGDMMRSERKRKDVIGMSPKKIKIFRDSRRLWFEHIAYFYMYMLATLKKEGRSDPEMKTLVNRLMKNKKDIESLLSKRYKPMEASLFGGLLKEHLELGVEITKSAYGNVIVDSMEVAVWIGKTQPLFTKWEKNKDEIARNLNKLNSTCWPLNAVKVIFGEHLMTTKELLVAILKPMNTPEELRSFSSASVKIMKMAKLFYKGVSSKKCTPREIANIASSSLSSSQMKSDDFGEINPSKLCAVGPSFDVYNKYGGTEETWKRYYRPENNAMESLYKTLGNIEGYAFDLCMMSGSREEIESKRVDHIKEVEKMLYETISLLDGVDLLVYSRDKTWNIIYGYYQDLVFFVKKRLDRMEGNRDFAGNGKEGREFNDVFAPFVSDESLVKDLSLKHRSNLADGLARLSNCVVNKVSAWASVIRETYETLAHFTRKSLFEVITDIYAKKGIKTIKRSREGISMPTTRVNERSEALRKERKQYPPRSDKFSTPPPSKYGFTVDPDSTCVFYPLPFVVELMPDANREEDIITLKNKMFSPFGKWLDKLRDVIMYRLGLPGLTTNWFTARDMNEMADAVVKDMGYYSNKFAKNVAELKIPGKARIGFNEREIKTTLDNVVQFVDKNARNFRSKGTRLGKWMEDEALLERFASIMTNLCVHDKRAKSTFNRMFDRYRTYLYIMVDTRDYEELRAQLEVNKEYNIPRYINRDFISFRNAVLNCVYEEITGKMTPWKDREWSETRSGKKNENIPHLESYSRKAYLNGFNKGVSPKDVGISQKGRYSPHVRAGRNTPHTFFDWGNGGGFWWKWTDKVVALINAVIIKGGIITNEKQNLLDYGYNSVEKLDYMNFLEVPVKRSYDVIREYVGFIEKMAREGKRVEMIKDTSGMERVEFNFLAVMGGWTIKREENKEKKQIKVAFFTYSNRIRKYTNEITKVSVYLPFSYEVDQASNELVRSARLLANAFTDYIEIYGKNVEGKEEEEETERNDRNAWGMSKGSHLDREIRFNESGSWSGITLGSEYNKGKRNNGDYNHHKLKKKVGSHFWKKYSKHLFKYLIISAGLSDKGYEELAGILFKKTGEEKARKLEGKLNKMIENMASLLYQIDFFTRNKSEDFKRDISNAVTETLDAITEENEITLSETTLFTWISAFNSIQEVCGESEISVIQNLSSGISVFSSSVINAAKFINNEGASGTIIRTKGEESTKRVYLVKKRELKESAKSLGKSIEACVKIYYSEEKEREGRELEMTETPRTKSGENMDDTIRRILGIRRGGETEEEEEEEGEKGRERRSLIVESIGDAFGRNFWRNYLKKLKIYLAKIADGNMKIEAPVSSVLFPESYSFFVDDLQEEMDIMVEDSINYVTREGYMKKEDAPRNIEMGLMSFREMLVEYINGELGKDTPKSIEDDKLYKEKWDTAAAEILLMCSYVLESMINEMDDLYYSIINFTQNLVVMYKRIVIDGVNVESMEGRMATYEAERNSEQISRNGEKVGLTLEACDKIRESRSSKGSETDDLPNKSETQHNPDRNEKQMKSGSRLSGNDNLFQFIRRGVSHEHYRTEIPPFF